MDHRHQNEEAERVPQRGQGTNNTHNPDKYGVPQPLNDEQLDDHKKDDGQERGNIAAGGRGTTGKAFGTHSGFSDTLEALGLVLLGLRLVPWKR